MAWTWHGVGAVVKRGEGSGGDGSSGGGSAAAKTSELGNYDKSTESQLEEA